MSLKKATMILLALTLLSRLLGVGREMAIAWKFGASAESDAFFIAYSIPYAFYSIVSVSLTAVIVPILAEYDAMGQSDTGMRIASTALNLVALVSAGLALVGVALAHLIATAMGGGFPPATLDLAARLTALMMPCIIFMSLAGVAGGILNNYKVYTTPAAGPVIMNVVAIAGIFFADLFGIQAVVVGTVLGAAAYTAMQIPSFSRIGFHYRFSFSWKDPAIRRIFTNIWSVMLISACYYVYNLTDFNLASGMKTGSITALNYATRFIQLPQGIFTLAVMTAIFPTLSAHAARGELDRVRHLLEKGIRIILLMAVPASVGLLVVGEPVMTILFQHGKFSAHDTEMANDVLFFLTLGLVGFSLNLPLIRCFYSLGNQSWPLTVVLLSIPVKVLLSILLGQAMDERGLALATSITYMANAIAMAVLLRRKLPHLLGLAFANYTVRLLGASLAMLLVVYVVDLSLSPWLRAGTASLLLRTGIDVAVGGLAFAGFGLLLSIGEIRDGFRELGGRLRALRPA